MEATPSVGLGKRSVLWVAADAGGTTGVAMAAMLIMAHLMEPAQFGKAAIVIGSVQFLDLFVGGLFHDGLIQNPDTDDDKFETAFSMVQVVAAAIIAVGAAVALIGQGTGWDATAWLFVGASLYLPFSGALGIGNARMRRDLIFRQVANASLVGRLAGSVLGIVFAALGLGAWSLVLQFVFIAVIQAAMLYWQSDWRPRPRRDFPTLWPICRFAVPYAFMHSLVALRLQGFLMAVAALMGLDAAGFVNVAFRLTTTPQVAITTAFTNLGLPLLARHQNSGPLLERSYVVLTQLVMSTTIPAFVGLGLTANDLVPVLLGDRWIEVVPLVQMVSLGIVLAFLRFPASTALRALGHVRYSFASSAFQLAFTMGGLLLLRPQSMETAVWLWVLPTAVQLPVCIFVVCKVSSIRLRVVFGSLLPALVATIAMVAAVMVVGEAMQAYAPIYRLAAKVACGAVTALPILLLANSGSRDMLRGWWRNGLARVSKSQHPAA